MQVAIRFVRSLLVFAPFFAAAAGAALAAPSSDTLLPRSTKGYISIARAAEFDERWQKTQFGQLLNDDLMQPFVAELRKQLEDKYDDIEQKLGITWDDLQGVPAGEFSLAILERANRDAALAVVMDVTGHQSQADKLMAAVEERFAAHGGQKTTAKHGDTTFTVFSVPAADAKKDRQKTVYFIKDNLLCGIDDPDEAEAILNRFSGSAKDNLKSVAAYAETMDRCRAEAKGLEPEMRWFVDPFAFNRAMRTLQEPVSTRNKQDMVKILSDQGFDAIKGAGGYVNLLVDNHIEILHRTSIYAPPVAGKENDPLRWNLGMRIMQLPNTTDLEPQSWVPRMSANYTSFNLQLADAFDNVGTLFDAIQGHEGAFANSLEGFEIDAYGPQVNVRKEFIANMGQRLTLVADYVTPITVGSERSIFAVEAANERQLAVTLDKWMSKEPDVERRELGDFVIWERMPPEPLEKPQVDLPSFTPLQVDVEVKPKLLDDEDRERVLPNSAVCVALGHLMMASDIDYLREILGGFGQRELLSGSQEYKQVTEVMNSFAPGPSSVRSFGLTDEEFRPTFELIRQGKMPQSETMLGKLLNNMLTTEKEREDGVFRKQRVDGSSLPNFEAVRRYFGPAGRVVRSDKDGWFLTGVVLNKQAP